MKTSTVGLKKYTKISPKLVNPRAVAGNAEEEYRVECRPTRTAYLLQNYDRSNSSHTPGNEAEHADLF